jgi:hypothetical protein
VLKRSDPVLAHIESVDVFTGHEVDQVDIAANSRNQQMVLSGGISLFWIITIVN